MFIQCSACNSKYLVNSADLKPAGRMVECASCGHQWYQEPNTEEEILSRSVPTSGRNQNKNQNITDIDKDVKTDQQDQIKNLPSTVVKEQKVSVVNSFLVVIVLMGFISIFWILRSYGINIFVLMGYYLHEFYFNFKLIISDIAKIIHQDLN